MERKRRKVYEDLVENVALVGVICKHPLQIFFRQCIALLCSDLRTDIVGPGELHASRSITRATELKDPEETLLVECELESCLDRVLEIPPCLYSEGCKFEFAKHQMETEHIYGLDKKIIVDCACLFQTPSAR